MAYADFGAFMPSESAYVNPGEYETVQRSIALQKASYLSTMDQFYADLEERGREFDLTLAFEKEKLGEETQLKEKELGIVGELGFRGMRLQEREATLAEKTQADEMKMFEETLGFEKQKEATGQMEWEQEFREMMSQFDVQTELKSRELDLRSREIELGGRAQQEEERMNLWGLGFGGVGVLDTVMGWF